MPRRQSIPRDSSASVTWQAVRPGCNGNVTSSWTAHTRYTTQRNGTGTRYALGTKTRRENNLFFFYKITYASDVEIFVVIVGQNSSDQCSLWFFFKHIFRYSVGQGLIKFKGRDELDDSIRTVIT